MIEKDIQHYKKIMNYVLLTLIPIVGFTLIFQHQEFYRSYLFAYWFWLSIPLGCLGLRMIHLLTGGKWGDTLVPYWEAAHQTLTWMTFLFFIVILGASSIYPWTHTPLKHGFKSHYLRLNFFGARAVTYLGIWWLLDHSLRSANPKRKSRWAALGLVLLCLTVTFSAIDWRMSLEPDWYSTIYGLITWVGQALTGYTFILFVYGFLHRKTFTLSPRSHSPQNLKLIDQGNILLVLVVTWAYLSFVQYLIIWAGNLPEESSWVVRRSQGGWQWVVGVIAVFQFALPFTSLLFRKFKKHLIALSFLSGLIFLIRILDQGWYLLPAFYKTISEIQLLDGLMLLLFGSLWSVSFFKNLDHLKRNEYDSTRPALFS